MSKNDALLYGIDTDYELKTYKYVGADYEGFNMKNSGLVWTVRQKIRKKRNRKKNTYVICNTYSEWENHIKSIIPQGDTNRINLLHFLNKRKSLYRSMLELFKIALIPFYVSTISMFANDMSEELKACIPIQYRILLYGIPIILLSGWILYSGAEKVKFYEDIVKIMELEIRK